MQIIPPCFGLGVKISVSELLCFESLTSFHISFILYQFKSPSCKATSDFVIFKLCGRRVNVLLAEDFWNYGEFSGAKLRSDRPLVPNTEGAAWHSAQTHPRPSLSKSV